MNQDKSAGQGEALERPPTLLETFGTHPLGITAGLLVGALIGFFGGLAAGPIGSLLGAVGGAVIGAMIGASLTVGPEVDLKPHDRYWREHYPQRPYVPAGADYADYGPAYRHGSRAGLRAKQPRGWPEAEAGLARTWDANKEGSRLDWEQARPAVRDAWDRLHEAPA